MRSEKETQVQINPLSVSIRFYRARRRKQIDINPQWTRINREIEELTRQKVRRVLHDGLSQIVTALAMRINFARRLMSTDLHAAQVELEKVEDLVRDTAREIRHVIFILRPITPNRLELSKEFKLLVEKMYELFKLEIDLSISEDLVNQLPLIDQRIIYSLVEEAIDSARKRNGTNSLAVVLNRFDQQVILLEIKDQGENTAQGEPPFQGQELKSIQKFGGLIGGSVKVEGNGTRMQILFPFSETADERDLPGS